MSEKIPHPTIITTYEGVKSCICGLDAAPQEPWLFASSAENDPIVRLWDRRNPDKSSSLTDTVLLSNPNHVGTLRYNPSNSHQLFVVVGLKLVQFDTRIRKRVSVIDLTECQQDNLCQKQLCKETCETIDPQLVNIYDGNSEANSDENDVDIINDFDISQCGRYICLPLDSGDTIICDLDKIKSAPSNHITKTRDYNIESFTIMNTKHETICGCAVFGHQVGKNMVFTGGNNGHLGIFFRFDCCILQHCWISKEFHQKQNMSQLNQLDQSSTHLVNPPFITSLKISPTGDYLGFALGNGMIGAYKIYESKIGKSKHVYFGPQPVFRSQIHSSQISCMDFISPHSITSNFKQNNRDQKKLGFYIITTGSDEILQITRFLRGRHEQVGKWKLNSNPSAMSIDKTEGAHNVIIGDSEGGIHQISIS